MAGIFGSATNTLGDISSLGQKTGFGSYFLGTPVRAALIGKDKGVLLQFDCVLNETHSRQSSPTAFPLEDGSMATDQLLISPWEIALVGMISDTPINTQETAISEFVGTVLTGLLPPLGIVGAGVATTAAQSVWRANKNAAQPTVEAFRKLQRLQGGSEATMEGPTLFTLQTSLRSYDNCFIKQMSVPRDAATGQVIYFNLDIGQVKIVSPMQTSIKVRANKALSSAIEKAGTVQPDDSKIVKALKKGIDTGTSKVTGTGG